MSDNIVIQARHITGGDWWIAPLGTTTQPPSVEWVRLTPAPADPWDACLDVDPFTGQPDHPCGDSCEGGCE